MKKSLVALLTIFAVISLLCIGALAKGNGSSGGNSPQGNNQQQGGSTQQNSGEMSNDSQGGLMQSGSLEMPATQYGRFLDVDKLGEVIVLMNEGEAKNNIVALMEAYREAVRNQNQTLIREALQAMIRAMTQTMEQTMEQTQLTEQDRERLRIFDHGYYLDTNAVAEAIAVLTDSDAAAMMTALLQTYTDAVATGDSQAIQDAFTALMTALTEVGVDI